MDTVRPYISNLCDKRLPSNLWAELEIPFSMEVKEAVFSMQKDKALGPDGFSMYFYNVLENNQRGFNEDFC